MALNRAQLIELARAAGKASINPSKSFSFEGTDLAADAVTKTFVNELNELGKDFEENKPLIFKLLQENLAEVVPAKVMQAYSQFADVKTIGFEDKATFKVKISEASKKRAKQFVTKVGEAGRYEAFKLDGYQFEVPTSTIGGAARIEWVEMMRGINLNDYYSLVLEGIDEAIYREIAAALVAMVSSIKAVNKTTQNVFNEKEMDRLLATADIYGKSTIYCTFEFAATMIPVTAQGTNWNAMSDNMKEQYWNNGAFATYKGHQVVILPQSFEDETNAKKVIDPSYCWIIPTGSEKPVKVVFQGTAQVKSFDNNDWSTDINTWQRIGVASYLVNPGICVYRNTSLTQANTPAPYTPSEATI